MPEVYEVYVTAQFSAAHRLNGYAGNCCRVHGHNWSVEAYVRSDGVDAIGIAVDFRVLKQALHEVLAELDHFDLNELPAFRDQNPTAENIAKHVYRALSAKINDGKIRVSRIKVSETPGSGAVYWES